MRNQYACGSCGKDLLAIVIADIAFGQPA